MPILVDLAVLAVVLLAAARGVRAGGLAPLLRLATALGGLLAGLWLARLLSTSLSPVWHVVLGAGCAIGGLVVGASLGRRLARTVVTARPAVLDRALGVVVRGGVALVLCGFVAALVVGYGPSRWADAVRASAVSPDSPADVPVAGALWQGAERLLQRAAPADLAALVPATELRAPDAATVDAVETRVAASVLRVSADRCGAGVTGTGFVAARGLVVTNAHVVAGTRDVRVDGHDASVVGLDDRTDLAVLRVPDLDVAALPLADSDAANGAGLVIVGYPGGRPRTAVPATVVQRMPVPNPGLAGGSLHQAYRLRAVIEHGNSGSPLLDTSGRVVGVVNALATTGSESGGRGFAISVDELRPLLTSAATATAAVDTGAC